MGFHDKKLGLIKMINDIILQFYKNMKADFVPNLKQLSFKTSQNMPKIGLTLFGRITKWHWEK